MSVYGTELAGRELRSASAFSDKVRLRIDRRYVVLGRCQYDRGTMRARERIRGNDKATAWLVSNVPDGRFDLYFVMNGRNDWLDLE